MAGYVETVITKEEYELYVHLAFSTLPDLSRFLRISPQSPILWGYERAGGLLS